MLGHFATMQRCTGRGPVIVQRLLWVCVENESGNKGARRHICSVRYRFWFNSSFGAHRYREWIISFWFNWDCWSTRTRNSGRPMIWRHAGWHCDTQSIRKCCQTMCRICCRSLWSDFDDANWRRRRKWLKLQVNDIVPGYQLLLFHRFISGWN